MSAIVTSSPTQEAQDTMRRLRGSKSKDKNLRPQNVKCLATLLSFKKPAKWPGLVEYLPVEILYLVLEYLPIADQLALRLCCRLVADLVDDVLWQQLELDFDQSNQPPGSNNNRLWTNHTMKRVEYGAGNSKIYLGCRVHILLWAMDILRGDCSNLLRVRQLTVRLPEQEVTETSSKYPTEAKEVSKVVCRQTSTETHCWIISWLLDEILPRYCTNLRHIEVIKTSGGPIEEYVPLMNFLQSNAHVTKRVTVPERLGHGALSWGGNSIKSLGLTNCKDTLFKIPPNVEELTLHSKDTLTVEAQEFAAVLSGLKLLRKLTLLAVIVRGCRASTSWLPSWVETLHVAASSPLNNIRLPFNGVKHLSLQVSYAAPHLLHCMSCPNLEYLYLEHIPQGLDHHNTILPCFFDTLKTIHINITRLASVHTVMAQLPSSVENVFLTQAYTTCRGDKDAQEAKLDFGLTKLTSALPYMRKLVLDMGQFNHQTLASIRKFVCNSRIDEFYLQFRNFSLRMVALHVTNSNDKHALTKLSRYLTRVSMVYEARDYMSDMEYNVHGYKIDVPGLRKYFTDHPQFGILKYSKKHKILH